MKYEVTIGGGDGEGKGRLFVVEIDGDEVFLDGRSVVARLDPVPETPLRYLEVDGRTESLAMVLDGQGWRVQVRGRVWAVGVVDERTRRLRELAGGEAKSGRSGVVKAPMPGMILRLQVEPGQRVKGGGGLVVLEAMKMENEIRAPEDGVVIRIYVEPGSVVEKGAPLVELGPSS